MSVLCSVLRSLCPQVANKSVTAALKKMKCVILFIEIKPLDMIYTSANLPLLMVRRSRRRPRDIFKCNLVQALWDIAQRLVLTSHMSS